MSDGTHKKERSPSFPFIPLREALKRLEAFEGTFGRHPAPASKAGIAWGMKENSSQAFQTLAALKAFGLVKYEGNAKDRTASLTDDARTYVRAQQESVKQEVIRRVALNPAQIQKFWSVWGADRPPDPVCLDDLVLKHAFTDNAANTFLKVYDQTIDFAGLGESTESTDEGPAEDGESAPFVAGDFINWERDGQLQWRTPRSIIAVDKNDDGRRFYKVTGPPDDLDAVGWIAVEEAVAAEVPRTPANAYSPPSADPSAPDPEPKKGQRKAVFPVSEGDVTFLFPEGLTSEGLQELESYLDVFLKREKREGKRGD